LALTSFKGSGSGRCCLEDEKKAKEDEEGAPRRLPIWSAPYFTLRSHLTLCTTLSQNEKKNVMYNGKT
jgi:hypothetical protein